MSQAESARKKILVVDDEADVCTYLETLLQDNGYDTITAKDGEVATRLLRQERPDLVTLDISMPEKSGVRFYRETKDDPELAKTPVVIVTAVTGFAGNADEFRRFLSTRKQIPPPEGFIAKPIDQQELLDTIKNLLA